MIDPNEPGYIPILLPSDAGVLSEESSYPALLMSAVYGANPRLAGLCAEARGATDTLLVDPKTPYFQFAGYMSMPDYRALPYSPGRHTLGSIWGPDHFLSERRRQWLIDEVFAFESAMGADILLAPYFYIRNANDPWLQVTRECASGAIRSRSDTPVGVVLSVDIDAFIEPGQRAVICDAFTDLDVDLFWINVINFDEVAAEPTDVAAVMALVDELVATGRPVVLGYVARTGLLAIAHGVAGYAAGTHDLETHPRSFFREMMGTRVANSYYLHECMTKLPVRLAEKALSSGIEWRGVPCDCEGCDGSTAISRMVSKRLSRHSMSLRQRELETLSGVAPNERQEAVERMFDAALKKSESVAVALGETNGQPTLPPGSYHYLEVLREVAGGPPATIPGDDSF